MCERSVEGVCGLVGDMSVCVDAVFGLQLRNRMIVFSCFCIFVTSFGTFSSRNTNIIGTSSPHGD